MAWVDDRIWCHPKFTDLTAQAFRAYVQGLAYSSGMNTRGRLTQAQQQLVGSDASIRAELVQARLWDRAERGVVCIHDWDDHNGKRDERRAADRERKRLARAKTSAGQSAGTSAGQNGGQSTAAAHVDGSEGSDGSEEKPPTPNPAVDVVDHEERERILKGEGVLNTL